MMGVESDDLGGKKATMYIILVSRVSNVDI